jgi:hypothetical protein
MKSGILGYFDVKSARVRKLYGMDVTEPTRTRAADRNLVIPV